LGNSGRFGPCIYGRLSAENEVSLDQNKKSRVQLSAARARLSARNRKRLNG
jgi:hypothetical protein